MATSKNRYINTAIWDDTWFSELEADEKLLFIYLLTNSLCNIAGIYEISLKRISFDTGIKIESILKTLKAFESLDKVYFIEESNYIVLKNFIKHQKLNPNIKSGILNVVNSLPEKVYELLFPESVKPFEAFESLSKSLNYINLNLNINLNINNNAFSKKADVFNSDEDKEEKTPFFKTEILNLWNELSEVKHTENNQEVKKALKTITKKEAENLKTAIERYCKANNDKNYFYNHKWTLPNFIKQKNGYKNWLDDGQQWINYQESIKTEQNSETQAFTHDEDFKEMMRRAYDSKNATS